MWFVEKIARDEFHKMTQYLILKNLPSRALEPILVLFLNKFEIVIETTVTSNDAIKRLIQISPKNVLRRLLIVVCISVFLYV